MSSEPLSEQRKKIDLVDDQIASLLLERFELLKEISELKKRHQLHTKDAQREDEIIQKFSSRAENNQKREYLAKLARHLLNESLVVVSQAQQMD